MLFFNNHHELSSDRLTRVHQSETAQRLITSYKKSTSNFVQKEDHISISDYWIFNMPDTDHYLIGLITGFSKSEVNAKREMYYKRLILLSVEINDENKSTIGISAM